jgi:PilZ domain
METNMSCENRKRERVAIDQIIELSTSEGQIIKAQGINMSEGGILCRSDIEIPQGTFVRFKFSYPSDGKPMSVECEGFVLRCVKADSKFDIVVDFTC